MQSFWSVWSAIHILSLSNLSAQLAISYNTAIKAFYLFGKMADRKRENNQRVYFQSLPWKNLTGLSNWQAYDNPNTFLKVVLLSFFADYKHHIGWWKPFCEKRFNPPPISVKAYSSWAQCKLVFSQFYFISLSTVTSKRWDCQQFSAENTLILGKLILTLFLTQPARITTQVTTMLIAIIFNHS